MNECEDWAVRWPEGSVKEWGLADWTWEVGEENIELVDEPNENWLGRKVRALAEGAFAQHIGDIGVVVEYDNDNNTDMHCRVRWEYDDDKMNMWADDGTIELVEEEKPMTDEEVWKMLEPKMTKNGFVQHADFPWEDETYPIDMAHKMVSLAYRVGYMRAKKGKPFKYERKVNVKNED